MPQKPDEVEVSLRLGLFTLKGKWAPDQSESAAAWEMYVELVTRVAVAPLPRDEGILRESLNSLYSLFASTREILRRHGPAVARGHGEGELSFAVIAVAVLNHALRPFLTHWHPELESYERTRGDSPPAEHEKAWARAGELRDELALLREQLEGYADELALAAGVPRLTRLDEVG